MKYGKCIRTTMLALSIAITGMAQTAPAPAPPPTPAPEPAWSVGPIDFSGLVDVYYDVNFNHPADRINQLRNFDFKANQFSLSMAKLTMEHTADPVGFRVRPGLW